MRPTLTRSPVFWAILLTCLAPVAIGSGLYLSGWAHGTPPKEALLQPPLLDANVTLWPSGKPLLRQNRWALIVVCQANNDDLCLTLLDQARRVHVALGKDFPRLQKIWAVVPNGDLQSMQSLAARFPDLNIVPMPPTWQTILSTTPALWVLSPTDRLRMRFPLPIEEKKIFSLLSRLLRYSWDG